MKAVVTGAAGFIGSTLAGALLADGHDVTGIDCFTDYYGRDLKTRNLESLRRSPRFRFVEAPLQTVDLAPVLDGATHVFHLAAQAGVRGSWGDQFRTYTTHNVDATQRLLEALVGRPVERVVYASSSSVYGDAAAIPMREDAMLQPVSPYGVTKLAAEHLCHLYSVNHGVPTVSLRYFTVYGPRQRPDMAFHIFCRAALEGEPLTVFGDGRQTRDFTFVADVVAATVAAADVPLDERRVFNIGGGTPTSIRAVLDQLGELAERELEVTYLDTELGDVKDTAADTTWAREVLGFAPTTTLSDGLEAEYRWIEGLLATQGAATGP